MPAGTLKEFLTLNDQLLALAQAGVPIYLGLPRNREAAAAAIERAGAAVARRVGQGTPLPEALADSRVVPPLYGHAMQLALQGGDFQAALAGAQQAAESYDEALHGVRSSLAYPLVLACLAYAGLVAFCLFFVPVLENTYRSLQLQPDVILTALQTLRAALPYWVALPPLALLLLWIWSRLGSRSGRVGSSLPRALSWLPGIRRANFEQRCAHFAESLARFLDAGASLSEALRLTAGVWDSEPLMAATRDLAAAASSGAAATEHSALAAHLPPFLRWALCHGDDTIGRAAALRMAASTYRQSARRRAERLRVAAPLVTCVVLGGGITLLYGLTLFVPVVQLLKGLAS